jgi:prephenate dehydratase
MTTMQGDMKKENNSPSSKKSEINYYRCGMTNHWSRTCRTPKHLVELYQTSIKKKKEVEIIFIENKSSGLLMDTLDLLMDTHLDISDFFENVNKEINIMN